MQPSSVLLVLAALVAPVFSAGCQNSPGVANGECVKYYGGNSCNGPEIGGYKPTCAGNCFVYDSFNSLHVAGDGTYGTNCVIYSDTNCQTEMTETGNYVTGGGHCQNVPGAKAMRCYYRC